MIPGAGIGLHSLYFAILCQNLRYLCLTNGEMFCVFQSFPHFSGVFLLVRLSPKRMYRRPFGHIQHLGLNKCFVNIPAHLSSQRVNFPHQMSLGCSSDIGVTGHQRNAFHTDRKHNRLQSQPCTGQSRLTAGMSGPYNGNVIIFF